MIALCISGHVRSFLPTYSLLKERFFDIIDRKNVDVFISTWDKISTKKSWSASTNPHLNINEIIDNPVDHEQLKHLYQPKAYFHETFIETDPRFSMTETCGKIVTTNPKISDGDLLFLIPMYYKIWHCNELKRKYEQDNNFQYDIVIRWRFDNYFTKKVSPADFENLGYCLNLKGFDSRTADDTFWAANSDIMDVACAVYPNLNKLLLNSEIGPEVILYKHLTDLGICFKNFPVLTEIMRFK